MSDSDIGTRMSEIGWKCINTIIIMSDIILDIGCDGVLVSFCVKYVFSSLCWCPVLLLAVRCIVKLVWVVWEL